MSTSPEPELLTLDELALKHGQIAPEAPESCPDSKYRWEHRVAAIIHGWTVHNYHYADHPMRLSDEAYLAALQAARDGIDPHTRALPHIELDTLPPEPEPVDDDENEHAQ